MLLISAIFLMVSLSECCASYLFIPCTLMNWIFLSQLFVGSMGRRARVDSGFLPQRKSFLRMATGCASLCCHRSSPSPKQTEPRWLFATTSGLPTPSFAAVTGGTHASVNSSP